MVLPAHGHKALLASTEQYGSQKGRFTKGYTDKFERQIVYHGIDKISMSNEEKGKELSGCLRW